MKFLCTEVLKAPSICTDVCAYFCWLSLSRNDVYAVAEHYFHHYFLQKITILVLERILLFFFFGRHFYDMACKTLSEGLLTKWKEDNYHRYVLCCHGKDALRLLHLTALMVLFLINNFIRVQFCLERQL